MLKRFDLNGDGRIDDHERADAREMMLQEQVDRQMARVAASQATPEVFRQRALEFFDANRDGRLDEDERVAAQKFIENRAAATLLPERAAWREEFLKRVDKNANGRIDSDERGAVRDLLFGPAAAPELSAAPTDDLKDLAGTIRAAIQANPDQRKVFDTDGNGQLDDKEWTAAQLRIGRAFLRDEGDVDRLARVAADVARRREFREKAGAKVGSPK
jgi:Ca2+-binding EF-hand superfamily protein